jgi:hypothetical protein
MRYFDFLVPHRYSRGKPLFVTGDFSTLRFLVQKALYGHLKLRYLIPLGILVLLDADDPRCPAGTCSWLSAGAILSAMQKQRAHPPH